jgi:hypothetical protein
MKIQNTHGYALILISGENRLDDAEVHIARYYESKFNYGGPVFVLNSGKELETQDYEDRFDCHYYPNDDGSIYYPCVHVLSVSDDVSNLPDPSSIKIPKQIDILNNSKDAVKKVLNEVVIDQIDPHDLKFAILVTVNFPMIYNQYIKVPASSCNAILDAQKALIDKIFF